MLLERRPDKYKLMVDQLLKKCEEIQSDNSRLVMRINNVKKQVRRRTRDVGLLKRRLDRYNDNWRMLPVVVPHPKRKIEQKRGPKPKIKDPKEPPKERKPRKQRAKKIVVATTPQVVANPRTTPAVLPTYIPKTSSVAIFNIRRPPNLPGSTTIHAHPPGHHPKPMYHQLHQQKPLQKHAAKLFQSLQRPPPTQHRPLFTEQQLSKLLAKNQHITIKH